MARLPNRLREEILIAHGFQCCLCGLQYFCDVHHIIYRSHGGNNDHDNLTVLCPSCHRAVHKGTVSKAALRTARMQQIRSVKRRRESLDHTSVLQRLLVFHFVQHHCIDGQSTKWQASVRRRSKTRRFAICGEFGRFGFIVNPANGDPLQVGDDQTAQLAGLEAVASVDRFHFLAARERFQRAYPERIFLIRLDVLDKIISQEIALREAREFNDDPEIRALTRELAEPRDAIRRLVRTKWSPDVQRRLS
jgi:HNH endonuclease